MGLKYLHNFELLDPEAAAPRRAAMLVDRDKILDVRSPDAPSPEGAEPIDLRGRSLAPGFLDLHFHGALIFASGDSLKETLLETAEALVRNGTTGYLATTVAWDDARLRDFVTQCQAEMTQGDRSCLLGVHLEGPWINPRAAGAQPGREIRPYSSRTDAKLLGFAHQCLRMVTMAPEVEGAGELLSLLQQRDIVASLGHSLASRSQIDAAVKSGMTHVTHLFNAMGPMHHREPGVAGFALGDDRLSCDLICDGVHVDPAMVRVASRAKREKLMLITDRIAPPTDAPESEPSFGSGPIRDDGSAIRTRDGGLAGSNLTLDCAMRNVQKFGAMTRLEAVAAATLLPARLLGIESERGTVRPGSRADFAILDVNDRVCETWIGGRCVWSLESPGASLE